VDGAPIICTVGKTGRTSDVLDVADLSGRTAKRRRRARIRARIGLVGAAALAVTTAVFAVTGAFDLVTDQRSQESYDAAPYCPDTTGQTQSCVLRTTASVDDVHASKNTGKSAHGYTTRAYLLPQVGRGQTVVLSASRDLTGSVHHDDTMPVLVWRDEITRFTFQGHTHDSDENPHHLVASDLAQVAMCLLAASLSGRPVIRRLLRGRIAVNPGRNRIADWTLVVLVPATAVAALLRASYAVSVLGLAGIAVLVLSAVWPFVPWVATEPVKSRPVTTGPAKRRLP
jgi:hypothetical protein